MLFRIRALELNYYRNIKNQERLALGPITSLVGPNESGKSSLLHALYQLNKYSISNKDTTKGTSQSGSGKPPHIKFYLEPDSELHEKLGNWIKNLSEKSLVSILVNGPEAINWKFKLAHYNKLTKSFQERDVRLKALYKNVSRAVVQGEIDNQQKNIQPDEELHFSGRSTKNMSLVRQDKLKRLPDDEILKRLIELVLDNIPKISRWPPQKYLSKGINAVYAQFYIKDSVPWSDFVGNPDKYPSTKRLFDIASLLDESFKDWHTVLSGHLNRKETRETQDYLDKLAKEITKVIRERWNQSKISISFTMNPDGGLDISIFENKKRIEPSTRSEGFKWFLSFLLYFFANREEISGRVFLMDQPGEHLHPGGQKELRKRLEELSEQEKNQVVYATQSPFLVDRNDWGRTQFLKKTESWTEIKTPTKIDVLNDTLLRESLGYTLSDVGQANENNIVPEGFTDRWIFQTITRLVKNYKIQKIGREKVAFDLNKLGFLEAKGATGKLSVFSKVQELKNANLNVIGIYDSDVAGEDPFQKSKGDPHIGHLFYSYRTILIRSGVKTGEDLIPEKVYKLSLKEIDENLANREVESLTTKPRDEKMKSKYGRGHREKKEKLWNAVIEKINIKELNEAQIKELLSQKETELTLRLINKAYRILEDQREK